MGFRAIESCTRIIHNTVIAWVQETGAKLPETEEIEDIPEVGELDESRPLWLAKKIKFGYGQQ